MSSERLSNNEQEEDKIVHDPEKARYMAEIEVEYRDLAARLKAYMAEHHLSGDAKRKYHFGNLEPKPVNSEDVMRELHDAGVRPADFEKLGEEVADMLSDNYYDIQKKMEGFSPTKLRAIIIFLKGAETVMDIGAWFLRKYVEDFEDLEKGYLGTKLWDRLIAGDKNSFSSIVLPESEKGHRMVAGLQQLKESAKTELERRKVNK